MMFICIDHISRRWSFLWIFLKNYSEIIEGEAHSETTCAWGQWWEFTWKAQLIKETDLLPAKYINLSKEIACKYFTFYILLIFYTVILSIFGTLGNKICFLVGIEQRERKEMKRERGEINLPCTTTSIPLCPHSQA